MHAPASTTIRRLALLTCVALLAGLTLAVPADAGVGKYRLGVTTGPPVANEDLKAMGGMRIRHARMIFSWDAIETRRPPGSGCAGGEYDGLGRYAVQIYEASKRGVRIMPIIFDSPGYVSGKSSQMPKTGSSAIDDYKCFLRALVKAFGRGGELPRERPAAKPITEYQIWNEQSLPIYAAGGKPNPKEYARFLKVSTRAIKSVDGKAKIVLGGIPERNRGISAKEYLKRFYKVKGIKKKFNVLALHPYAKNARGVKGALIRLRKLLRRVGDKRRVVWLTEVGWASKGPKGHFLVTSEKGQAKKTRSTLKLLKRTHKRYRVGTVDWFRWRDQRSYSQSGDWWDFAGLYRSNGTPKPACHKYRRFTGAGGNCKKIVAEEAQSSSMLAMPDIHTQASGSALLPSPPAE